MIFITGTTGLVGAHLLEFLLSKNHEVKALIRKEEDKKTFRFDTKNVQWIVGDVLDINVIDEALKGVEKVFHCAAIVSYSSKRVSEMKQINIEGTANIVNLCLENNIEKLCY